MSDVLSRFLNAKRHPHPRYGCVCGVAHMGEPEIVLAHFFQKFYPSLARRFLFTHVWWGGTYIMVVECRRCGRREFLGQSITEAVKAAYSFMLSHKCP